MGRRKGRAPWCEGAGGAPPWHGDILGVGRPAPPRRPGPRHVGVIHDLGNLLIEGYEVPLPAFQLLGEYLAHIHVKNTRWVRREAADESGAAVWENEWAPLQSGQGSVLQYFRALAEFGYDGWVTVEDFSTDLPLKERTAGNLDYLRRTAALAGLTVGAGVR